MQNVGMQNSLARSSIHTVFFNYKRRIIKGVKISLAKVHINWQDEGNV